MQRDYHAWHSPALDRTMELLVFGHAGKRLLVFPTSTGRFYDWENCGMVDTLREPIERGRVQLICVDSVDAESWYAPQVPPENRVQRQEQYDAYLLQEVIPFVHSQDPQAELVTIGASLGGYHALNFAVRHPELVREVIGLSGYYGPMTRFTDGYDSTEVRAHTPAQRLKAERGRKRLEALRKLRCTLSVGADDPLAEGNRNLAETLQAKKIAHDLYIWPGHRHDWTDWRAMVRLIIH